MNRRNFFRNLVIGAVSAPAIAKVLAEEPQWRVNPEWELHLNQSAYGYSVFYTGATAPESGFTAPWFNTSPDDAGGWHVWDEKANAYRKM